jgi:mono/diheme cytochrome c family protein
MDVYWGALERMCLMVIAKVLVFSALIVANACGRVDKGDVTLPIGPMPAVSASGSGVADKSSGGVSTGSNQASSNSTSSSSGSSQPGGSGVVPMTLDEAKAKCAGCHQPGGSGAGVWSAANGTEADWKAFAAAAKSSVVAGRMPIGAPMTADEKSKLIAYFDKLLGIVPAPGGNAPGGGTTPPPVVTKFTFETARVLCVGCHSASAPQAVRESPYLETLEQWVREKASIRKEVRSGAMPQGKAMTMDERKALLDFIEAL